MSGQSLNLVQNPYAQAGQLRNLLKQWPAPEFAWLDQLSEADFAQGIVRAGQLKRLEERWAADPDFKAQAAVGLDQALTKYGLTLDLFDRVGLTQPPTNPASSTLSLAPSAADFRLLLQQRWRQVGQTVTIWPHTPFKAWRERQIARCVGQLKKFNAEGLIHAPVAFELSRGCSVGCWFCAMSAARLEDIFSYTPANARLWRNVLKVIKKIIGPAAGTGLCYWATDPLDNPDYEKFCCDFHAILGLFPQTTTAQPLKDPVRTRALLQLSLDKGNPLNRFSILSLRMLDRLHAEFSAEELALVELVLQNKEGTGVIKFEAGRVRDRLKQNSAPTNRLTPGTSACVSGFLINMVERRVKLISPCPASDRWPQGYMIFDEGTFTNGHDLQLLLERMIAEHMPLTVKPDHPLRFRPDLSYEAHPDGFHLSTPYARHKFGRDPYLAQLGQMIWQGNKTAAEIAQVLEWCAIPPTQTFQTLDLLLRQGVLDERLNFSVMP